MEYANYFITLASNKIISDTEILARSGDYVGRYKHRMPRSYVGRFGHLVQHVAATEIVPFVIKDKKITNLFQSFSYCGKRLRGSAAKNKPDSSYKLLTALACIAAFRVHPLR